MTLINYLIVAALLLLSGLFSGLTLGLMGLNKFDLERKVALGDKLAKKIYPLRRQGNLLLCTLLLGNVAVNSALAVFLGSITTGILAGVIATSLIVIFGEIVPQSVFSRYAMKLGAATTWLVYIFLIILYPISKPLSSILDHFLGGELPTIFSKREFHLFLQDQKRRGDKSDIGKNVFNILEGGLIFSEKRVREVMTPRVHMFRLEDEMVLDKALLQEIHDKGHSRIPVYDDEIDHVVGILFVKDLIVPRTSKKKLKVKDVMRKKVHKIFEHERLDKVFELFKSKKMHMFVVLDEFNGVEGIVTLEDVLEEIVGEIVDEDDHVVNMRELTLD
ncbi:CNNM domain-containing protein [Nanoarchaeota archaeon]